MAAGAAPITERDTHLVSAGMAQFEQWAAVAVMDADGPRPPLELIATQAGVPYLPPQATNPDWASGTWRTLLWLTGTGRAESPIPVPRRHNDGTALTEQDFLRELLADPRCALPEQRAQARIDAATQAQRNRGLVARSPTPAAASPARRTAPASSATPTSPAADLPRARRLGMVCRHAHGRLVSHRLHHGLLGRVVVGVPAGDLLAVGVLGLPLRVLGFPGGDLGQGALRLCDRLRGLLRAGTRTESSLTGAGSVAATSRTSGTPVSTTTPVSGVGSTAAKSSARVAVTSARSCSPVTSRCGSSACCAARWAASHSSAVTNTSSCPVSACRAVSSA